MKRLRNRLHTRLLQLVDQTLPAYPRVGQLDSELLDEQLYELLKKQLDLGLSLLSPISSSNLIQNIDPELTFALGAVLFKLSIWNQNASYGAMLQGLEYRRKGSNMPSSTKLLYFSGTVGLRYIFARSDLYLTQLRVSDSSSSIIHALLRTSKYLQTTHTALSLLNFLIFLKQGRYRTLLDRMLGVSLTPKTRLYARAVSYEFMNRQLVWHAFTEFLLFILPLLHLPRLKRRISKYLSTGVNSRATMSQFAFLPPKTCAICYRDQGASDATQSTDTVNAYVGDCGCGGKYCYSCIAGEVALEEGEGWNCLRCNRLIRQIVRYV